MEKRDKNLDFVVKYYKPNRFSPDSAIARFKREQGVIIGGGRRWIAVAASFVAVLVVALFSYLHLEDNSLSNIIKVSALDKIERIYLHDSTLVILYPNSYITYNKLDYGKQSRAITMEGQVYFDVCKGDTRFNIKTTNATVEVLGTQFQVKESDKITEVIVKSGEVRLSAKESIIVTTGESAISSDSGVELITEKRHNPLAWATKEFIYEDTPISEVVSELADFYNVEISSSDNNKRITATFSTDSLYEIIVLLESSLDIEILVD